MTAMLAEKRMAEKISARDMLLVAMLARGHTTDRTAHELRLSRHTVSEVISILLERFNCRNRAELVAYWYAHQLLPTGVWPPPYPSGAAGRRRLSLSSSEQVPHVRPHQCPPRRRAPG